MREDPQTLSQAIQAFLDQVLLARSANTANAYRYALEFFKTVLSEHNLSSELKAPTELSEDAIGWLADALKDHAPATERLYLTAAMRFYEYLAAERLAAPNLPRLRLLVRHRARRSGVRLPQFHQEEIEKTIEHVKNVAFLAAEDKSEHLRALRDRAFLLTLADTGLRVHEACKLRRGDLDWNEGRAILIGKGDKQAVVRFSQRALEALRSYLHNRAQIDGTTGKPLASLPLFARHDKGAGKKIKPITTTSGRNIVHQRAAEALGAEAAALITPHSFRHYFVTSVLRGSGNLKLAQALARHSNIQVTQRYAHLSDDELDQGYLKIFDDTEHKTTQGS